MNDRLPIDAVSRENGSSVEATRSTMPEGAKAQRVYLSIREDIANGLFPTGKALPGEQKLAATFAVSRVTIRRALEALCADGLIDRKASSGTVVCAANPLNTPLAMDFTTLMPQLAEMSRTTTARLLSFTYGPAPGFVADAMGLDADAQVQIATRIRLTNDQPFSHLTTYVPEPIARNYSESDLASQPLFALLERSGVNIDSAHQSASATLASPTVAAELGIAVGSALLSLQRVVRDSEGHGVEFLYARYRPDLFRLDMTLERVGDASTRHWEPAITPQQDTNGIPLDTDVKKDEVRKSKRLRTA